MQSRLITKKQEIESELRRGMMNPHRKHNLLSTQRLLRARQKSYFQHFEKWYLSESSILA
jgi:hypothetical protein